MSIFNTIRFPVSQYGLLGNWSQPAGFPKEVYRNWAIRILQDNRHITKGNTEFEYWFNILKHLPLDSYVLSQAFWEETDQTNLMTTASNALLLSAVQAVSGSLDNEYGPNVSDFIHGIFDAQEMYVKEQHAEVSKYYSEDPLDKNAAYVVMYMTAKKYEDWLREEISSYDMEGMENV